MQRILAAALAIVAALVFALPTAAGSRDRIGPRINVLRGTPTTYPAGAPFRIEHGWSSCLAASDLLANGRLGFDLDVDGVEREPSFVDVSRLRKEDTGLACDVLNRSTVYNFPNGLPAGSHTFRGHWIGPCKPLVGDDQYDAICANPAEVIEAGFSPVSLTVEFS